MGRERALCVRAKLKTRQLGEKKKMSTIVEIMFEHICKQRVTGQSTRRLRTWGRTLQ